jgi:hypothetical protein
MHEPNVLVIIGPTDAGSEGLHHQTVAEVVEKTQTATAGQQWVIAWPGVGDQGFRIATAQPPDATMVACAASIQSEKPDSA